MTWKGLLPTPIKATLGYDTETSQSHKRQVYMSSTLKIMELSLTQVALFSLNLYQGLMVLLMRSSRNRLRWTVKWWIRIYSENSKLSCSCHIPSQYKHDQYQDILSLHSSMQRKGYYIEGNASKTDGIRR